jgi:hypothetical protein
MSRLGDVDGQSTSPIGMFGAFAEPHLRNMAGDALKPTKAFFFLTIKINQS